MSGRALYSWLFWGIGFAISASISNTRKQPHVLLFLVDDLGWNDVGFHGMTEIPTPNIDMLAFDGTILNNFYVEPTCTPSRAALMTGYYPSNIGIQHEVLHLTQPAGLPLHYRTLPQELNSLGYTSHMVGKWHLGFFKKEYTPTYRGFKSHYGFWWGANDFFFHNSESFLLNANRTSNVPLNETRKTFKFEGYDFRDDMRPVTTRAGEYLTDLFTERAVEVIYKHPIEKPLFLYMAHHGVHRGNFKVPMSSPPKYTNGFRYIRDETRRNFAGSLKAVDYSLGEIVAALGRKGILRDTIIIFSSDNGCAKSDSLTSNGGSNYPLRGSKFTGWEGGVKAASFIWSPIIKRSRGKMYDGLMHISDILPTLYEAAGGDVKRLGNLDGLSLWSSLQGKEASPRENILLLSDSIWNMTSYRSGNYKIISGSYPEADLNGHAGTDGKQQPLREISPFKSQVAKALRGIYDRPLEELVKISPVEINCGYENSSMADYACDPKKDPCLFNVKEDPCEYRNIAKEYPQILKKLKDQLGVLRMNETAPWLPLPDYNSNPAYHEGFWSSWQND